jgi:hypothetical protein
MMGNALIVIERYYFYLNLKEHQEEWNMYVFDC